MSPILPSLRELRGAALSVLLALYVENRPVTRAWLERRTGYSHKPIINSLAYFCEHAFAVRTSQGWLLTEMGKTLARSFTPEWKYSTPTIINNDLDIDSGSIIIENEIGVEKSEPQEFPPNASDSTPQKDPHLLKEIWAELSRAGIKPNERTRKLAQLPHITPDYVSAHRRNLEQSGRGGSQWAGLLITTLESGEPVPEEDNSRLKYITGKYAAYIEH